MMPLLNGLNVAGEVLVARDYKNAAPTPLKL
jgi:hypothetical protein